jgi:hypothetical protein
MTEAEAISLLLKVAREWLTEYPFVASAEKVREAVETIDPRCWGGIRQSGISND